MDPPPGVLAVHEAKKAFGTVAALDGASLELRAGELLGLLGPNGAGKTTLVRALAGRVRLDSGRIELLGRALAPRDPRPELGIVPQEIALYPLLTARENLHVFGRLQGLGGAALDHRIDQTLEWTALGDRGREPVRNFSGGMKRRLNIAAGLLHEPRVVLLDEPTVGVDPQSRERIYEVLARLREAGTSLLLTTHQLEEAEARCQRLVVIDHGRVIASGSVAELIEKSVGVERTVTCTVDPPLPHAVDGFTVDPGGTTVHARLRDVGRELPELLGRLRAAGLAVEDVRVRSPSLHAAFIHLTGRELRE